jgi:hypothetical protein
LKQTFVHTPVLSTSIFTAYYQIRLVWAPKMSACLSLLQGLCSFPVSANSPFAQGQGCMITQCRHFISFIIHNLLFLRFLALQ